MNNLSYKSKIRKEILAKRQNLSLFEIEQCSHAIVNQVTQLDCYQKSQHIAFYYSVKNEVQTHAFIQQALLKNKTCYLPKITSITPPLMNFYRVENFKQLEINRYGIPEPKTKDRSIIAPDELDLVIVPMVAFDLSRNRLGMGAGFYDRYFHGRNNSKPFLVGLAYEFQRIEQIPLEPWDLSMDLIVTELKIYI